MEEKIQSVFGFLLGDQPIVFLFVNPDNFVLKNFSGNSSLIRELNLEKFRGRSLREIFYEFFGMDGLIQERYKSSEDRKEIYNLEPVFRSLEGELNGDTMDKYYRFQLVKFSNEILFIIYDVTRYYSNIREISQTHHDALLMENELKETRDRLNGLLENIFPSEVLRELEHYGHSEPRYYEDVTVMFTDFVDFTSIVPTMTHSELIQDLDRYFTQFEHIAERNKLEKLKTIGDSFMCVGGLQRQQKTHPVDACLAALEIQVFMRELQEIRKQMELPLWKLRIGVNTGPVIAGVIGKKQSAFDIWGDAVNIASRVESLSPSGEVLLSANSYARVKEFFDCENLGESELKNGRSISIYKLKRIKKELSREGDGILPNEKFQKMYARI